MLTDKLKEKSDGSNQRNQNFRERGRGRGRDNSRGRGRGNFYPQRGNNNNYPNNELEIIIIPTDVIFSAIIVKKKIGHCKSKC